MELTELKHEIGQAVTALREELKSLTEGEIKERDEKVNAKLDELQSKWDALSAQVQRPKVEGGKGEKKNPELSKEFGDWARRGEGADINRSFGETSKVLKTISAGNWAHADGGYAVPEELDRAIDSFAVDFGVMRQLANVIQIGTPDYKKLVGVHGATSGWGGETTARTNTNTPQIEQVAPSMGELWALAHATQQSLDDLFFDVEAFLGSEIGIAFAVAEGAAFVSGNGVNRPKGFLAGNIVTSADSARTFGEIQYIASGAAADFPTANGGDVLIDMETALKQGYRNGAAWLGNKSVISKVRKFKDAQNAYLWQPSLQLGTPQTILGYPVYIDENMPAVGANNSSLALANWRLAYTVVDRVGTRMLRDPYSAKPYVQFYATRRVGGMLVNSEAIKVIKFANS